jgi:ferrochelatase
MEQSKPAVILENLGTPDSAELKDVRPYLRQFLSDRRIVAMPRILWKPILELGILRGYAPRSARRYAKVWTPVGSPLMVRSWAQVEGLRQRLGDEARVELAMRYGRPNLAGVLDRLRADGTTKVLLVPTYAQDSTTTIASVRDDLDAYLAGHDTTDRDVDMMAGWYDDPGYIAACVGRIEADWASRGRPDFAAGDKLILSFHGIPRNLVAKGDHYPDECHRTATLIRQGLAVNESQCPQTFQSKFGPAAWLKPATIATVRELGASGVKRLDVFCPGFAVDCLNDDPAWLDAWATLIRARLASGNGG